MNMVNEKYPDIQWIYDKKDELKKENYDACDSLVCVLAYINEKKYGEMQPTVEEYNITQKENGDYEIDYVMRVWDKKYYKRLVINNEGATEK